MAAELNLPEVDQSDKQEEKEQSVEEQQNLTEEPEPEVPEDEMSSVNVVPVESKSETIKLEKDERESAERELDPKTIGAEVAALLDAVDAETEKLNKTVPDVVLRKKGKEEEELGRRGSTFLTEIEDTEEVGPEVAKIANKIVTENISDIESDDHLVTSKDNVDTRVPVNEPLFVEKIVQPLGTFDDTSDNKELKPIDEVDTKEVSVSKPTIETIGEIQTVTETSSNKEDEKINIKETDPKDTAGAKDSPIDKKESVSQEIFEEKVKSVENKPVDTPVLSDEKEITKESNKNLPKAEVELIGSISDTSSTNETVGDDNESKTLIDITVIADEDNRNEKGTKGIPSSESETKEELEEAIKEIPEMSSSVSVDDLLGNSLKEEEKSREVVEEIEIKGSVEKGGALIDITVIEETENSDKSVQEIVKEAEEAFAAELIPDDADIQVVGDEGEKVVELTMEAGDAIPLGAIAVATFAIFLALIFYWN